MTQPSRETPVSQQKAIETTDLSDGLDRITLTRVKQRFMALNQQRLNRLRASLIPPQRLFLDVLPLIFHVNHPALPGYLGNSAPAGIENFRLSHLQVKSARKLSSSFALHRELNPSLEIAGLYLMGSCSSLTHQNRSDLDIWVAVRDDMSRADKNILKEKCAQISEWAETLRLETHFFVMEESAFRHGKRSDMTDDDCGTTQHYLLLDEFYRTSIVMAGCAPLWWYVPAEQEHNYDDFAQTLIEKRYLDAGSVIDYGSPGVIPPQEFITAGLWQLFKGIGSPEKSLLKLMLIEVYAAEHPKTNNLSWQFKASLYQSETHRDEFDPYLQVYRHVEQYLLERNENDRIESLRRSLYLKANVKLSNAPVSDEDDPEEYEKEAASAAHLWKRRLMLQLVKEWGWRRARLVELDNCKQWRFHQVKSEQTTLNRELVRGYQLLGKIIDETAKNNTAQLAEQSQTSRLELNLLGRQLYAAFEHKPNKLSQLTHALSGSLAEPRLNFDCRQDLDKPDNQPLWTLSIDEEPAASRTTVATQLKQSRDPAQLLVWAIVNGLINAQTRFSVTGNDSELSDYELKQLSHSLLAHLPQRGRQDGQCISRQQFGRPAKISQCLFIANCGIDPLKSHKLMDIWHVTSKHDPLAYSAIAENLIANMTIVAINTWGEVYCHSFDGIDTINHALTHYFGYLKNNPEHSLPKRSFFCASNTKPVAIVNRLTALYDDIEHAVIDYSAPTPNQPVFERADSHMYLFESALGVHAFRWQAQTPSVELYTSEDELLAALTDQRENGKLTIDSEALNDHALKWVVRTLEARNKSGQLEQAATLFYELEDKTAHVYLADQKGALAYAALPYDSVRALITPIKQFVDAYCERQYREDNAPSSFGNSELLDNIACYALRTTNGRYMANQVPTESDLNTSILAIKATGQKQLDGTLQWSFFCKGEQFEESLLGEQVYLQLAECILQHRSSNQQHYRCYITDVEVQGDAHDSSLTRNFNYKTLLETRLNDACLKLLPDV